MSKSKTNINNIFRKFSNKNHQFGKIKRYVDIKTWLLVCKQMVLPLVEYESFKLLMNNKHDTEKLQKLHNRSL